MDRRIAILQELPGECGVTIPSKIKIDISGQPSEKVKQGDTISCTGIYKAKLNRRDKGRDQKKIFHFPD